MIIDSHAHIFPPLGGPSGFKSQILHSKYIQHALMFHHQPVRRLKDHSVVNEQNLYDENNITMEGLANVDFRGGGFGRLAWTAGGDDHYLQYLPPTLIGNSASAELMIAQMDYVGIGRAVLQTGHLYGRLNRYLSMAVKKFPDRFWALAMIDEWRADSPSQLRILENAITDLGLHGLWFQTSALEQHGRPEHLCDPVFYPFWDNVKDMGIPVYMNVTAAGPGPKPYLDQLAAFECWLQRYSDIPVMYPHGLSLYRFMRDGEISIPDEAWRPLEAPNLIVEILIPIFQGAIWEYPFIEAQPIIREYYNRLGPDRLAWASDMPNVERHCTYKQSLDYLRKHCDFIPSTDMDKICGDNVARLFMNPKEAFQKGASRE